ncbi:Putative ABC transporter, substrate-binding protein [Escherichia coli]|nr:Putative ABC transporter, substrate-binding protein [Escherichia coli]
MLSRYDLDFISRCRDGMAFTGVTYYDGIGFLTHDKAGLKSAKELDGATVCIQAGTDTELNVADYFKANNMKYTPVTFDRSDESARKLWNQAAVILWPRINHNCMPYASN